MVGCKNHRDILFTIAPLFWILLSYCLTLLLWRPIMRKFLEHSLPKSIHPTMLSQEMMLTDRLSIKLHKWTRLESKFTLASRLRPQFEIFKHKTRVCSLRYEVADFRWRLCTWQWPLNQFERNINNSFHCVGNTLL